jgi:hypothetical protein
VDVDFDQPATLSGIPPSNDTYRRGGPLAQGTVGEMVKRGLEYIAKGYTGVAVLHDGGLLEQFPI